MVKAGEKYFNIKVYLKCSLYKTLIRPASIYRAESRTAYNTCYSYKKLTVNNKQCLLKEEYLTMCVCAFVCLYNQKIKETLIIIKLITIVLLMQKKEQKTYFVPWLEK